MVASGKTRLDYDSDILKHYVRLNAWLPAAREQHEAIANPGPLRYFTFCAASAIDVFMLLDAGLLDREPDTGCIEGPFFCEEKPEDFNRISQLLGAHDQGIMGTFEDIVLFEDDDETAGKSIEDEAEHYPRPLREKLWTKQHHHRFRAAFPFDVINLDLFGTWFPPKAGALSPTLKTVRRLLEWQREPGLDGRTVDTFTLFITSHVERGKPNASALAELRALLEANKGYTDFERSFTDRFGSVDAQKVLDEDFDTFYALALPKMIIGEAYERGWLGSQRFRSLHRRRRKMPDGQIEEYKIISWVGRFERIAQPLTLGYGATPANQDYVHQIVSLVADDPIEIDEDTIENAEAVADDLARVVAFREDHAQRILGEN